MKEQIISHLPEDFLWQNQIHWFSSIDSTNLEAKRRAQQGAPHGTVLIADHQALGRGRMGRTFLSPAGMGIYMSVLLRPHCPPEQLLHLTCAAAVAMCNAVECAVGLRPQIKWTNDLVYRQRKIAGILTELSIDPKTGLTDHAILGIGINCCQRPTDFDPEIQSFAGSLAMFMEQPIDRAYLAANMICSLAEMAASLAESPAAVLDQYRRDCMTIGKEVSLLRPDGAVRHGYAEDVDESGALIVRFSDNSVEKVNSGEISVRGMYGYV